MLYTWPPVSGNPRTSACPKYPWTENRTTLKVVGTLLKNLSMFTESGAWSTSERYLIVSITLPALSPHPFSKPHSLNLWWCVITVTSLLYSPNTNARKARGHLFSKLVYGVSLGSKDKAASATISAPWSLRAVLSVSLIISFCKKKIQPLQSGPPLCSILYQFDESIGIITSPW